eukprot:5091463-Heterocapsa_arctica.AAC.1
MAARDARPLGRSMCGSMLMSCPHTVDSGAALFALRPRGPLHLLPAQETPARGRCAPLSDL